MTNSKTKDKRPAKISREILSIFIWSYILIKLFIFDFDAYLLSVLAPGWEWILNIKFLIVISWLAIIWLLLGHGRFVLLLLYTIFYPLIVLLWKIPIFLLRRWVFVLLILPTVINFISKLRSTFILFTLAIISVTIIFASQSTFFLIISMVILGIILITIIFRAFQRAQSLSFFSALADFITDLDQKINNGEFDKAPEAYTSVAQRESNNDVEKTEFPHLFIYHVFTDIVTSKVVEAEKTKKYNSILVFTLLNLLLLTTTIFGLENWALYKIDPTAFANTSGVHFFSFLAYSFGQITTAQLTNITAQSSIATLLASLAVFSGIIILAIGSFYILTAARDAYREDLQLFSESLQHLVQSINNRIKFLYSLSPVELEISLAGDHNITINFLRKIRGLDEILNEENSSAPETSN